MSHSQPRVICHIDMDAFYCQVERERFPHFRRLPLASCWTGHWAITTSYESRVRGLPKTASASKLAQLCPTMKFVAANMARYRAASREWLTVFRSFPMIVIQRKSIDECLIDLTQAVKHRIKHTRLPLARPVQHRNFRSLKDNAAKRFERAEQKWREAESVLVQEGIDSEMLPSSGSLRAGLAYSLSSDPITTMRDQLGHQHLTTNKHKERMTKLVEIDARYRDYSEDQFIALAAKVHPIDYCRASRDYNGPIELTGTHDGADSNGSDGSECVSVCDWSPWVGHVIQSSPAQPHEASTDLEVVDDGSDSESDDEDSSVTGFSLPKALYQSLPSPAGAIVGDLAEIDQPPVDFSREDPDNPSLDYMLCVGSQLAYEMRAKLFEQTGFTTSAGIAPNPMLAKLASGQYKPNQQSVVRQIIAQSFVRQFSLSKFSGFGPRRQEKVKEFGYDSVSDFQMIPRNVLLEQCGTDIGGQLDHIRRGIDERPVVATGPPKSINQSKRQPVETRTEKLLLLEWLAANLYHRIVEDSEMYDRWPSSLGLSWVEDSSWTLRTRRRAIKSLQHHSECEAVRCVYDLSVSMMDQHCPAGVLLCLSLTASSFGSSFASQSIQSHFPRPPLASGGASAGVSEGKSGPEPFSSAKRPRVSARSSSPVHHPRRTGPPIQSHRRDEIDDFFGI